MAHPFHWTEKSNFQPLQPFLARLQKLLRPTIVEVLVDPFLAAQLGLEGLRGEDSIARLARLEGEPAFGRGSIAPQPCIRWVQGPGP
jgi:hypothetical protein